MKSNGDMIREAIFKYFNKHNKNLFSKDFDQPKCMRSSLFLKTNMESM